MFTSVSKENEFSLENHTNLIFPLFPFKSFNPALYVNYGNNKKAWMTSALFQKWLVNFNSEMRRNKKDKSCGSHRL
jgi:hypothetical protein